MFIGRSVNLSDESKEIFCRYHWPGNVEELKNLVRVGALYGDQDSIIAKLSAENSIPNFEKLGNPITEIYSHADITDIRNHLKNSHHLSLKDICDVFVTRAEKKLLKNVLEKTNWNRKKAAMMLSISYKSLLNKIKAYDLV